MNTKNITFGVASLIFVISLIGLVSAENCTYQDAFYYCYEVDTNQDYVVDSLDSLQDYNIDGVINQSDEAIFNTFVGCSWDSNAFFNSISMINLTRTITLDEVYQVFQNMGVTYGMQRLAGIVNGTCVRNQYEYYRNVSDQMIKTGDCSYILSSTIQISKNGHLILDNCKLEVGNSDENGGSGIYDIRVDGVFTANYSTIKAVDLVNGGAYSYDFYTTNNSWVQFNLMNSIIKNVGHVSVSDFMGLTLNTNNVTFINNTLSRAHHANLVLGADNIIIKDSVFLGAPNNSLYPMYNILNRAKNGLIINSHMDNWVYRDIALTQGGNITLLNTSHQREITFSDGGELYKKWFVGVKTVNNLGNPISGVNVTFKNISGGITYSGLTNSSGYINNQEVLEYISNGTTRTYQTNYTISTSKRSYLDTFKSINITKSEDLIISLTFPTGGIAVKPKSI